MATNTAPITWKGDYVFRLSGSGLHEDTLRVESSYRKQEQMLKLILPTLCITYADSNFQDSVGGEQENFPSSRAYGPTHFDPPIEILGEEDIEKVTYIRGAYRVQIGPEKTIIEFPSWRNLVIPRLRLDQREPAEADLHVPDTQISVDEPLQITALQYADGRHVGGVRLEKRHPDWRPPKRKEVYSLWLRVIDGATLQPLPEVMVDILHWDSKASTPYGAGGFRLGERMYTDGYGCIQVLNRPSGELEAYVVRRPGARAVVRCLRPLAGQNVRLHMRVWPLKSDTIRIVWPSGEKLALVAQRTGRSVEDILQLNQLKSSSILRPGVRVNLPCHVAAYELEPWDTLDWVGKTFGYRDAKGLAEVNGLKDVADLDGGVEIKLPDWRFYSAQENDTLDRFDRMFGLPKASSITVGRVFHPDPRLPYPGETVAVPAPFFAERMKKERKGR
jgi:hypothetical protein